MLCAGLKLNFVVYWNAALPALFPTLRSGARTNAIHLPLFSVPIGSSLHDFWKPKPLPEAATAVPSNFIISFAGIEIVGLLPASFIMFVRIITTGTI